MATATKYEALAQEILRAVGGEHNVASVTHCATRLRFQLKDRDKADKAAVENTKGVITVVEAGGQFQVVIGNTVNNEYEALVGQTSITPGAEGGTQGGILARAIDLITSIVTPFLWVLAGTGLRVDLAALQRDGFDPSTPVVVANGAAHVGVRVVAGGQVAALEPLLIVDLG